MDYDQTNIPETYDRGRDHGPAFTDLWMGVISQHVAPAGVRCILDVGCGTGRFSRPLAQRFDGQVIGIDPSRKMLLQAINHPNGSVLFANAVAEALPLDAHSIDMVFMSMVFHHFSDPSAVARECRRVLRSGGSLCLRTASVEMIPRYPYVPFFPTSRRLLEARLPSLAFQRRVFEAESFRLLSTDVVIQEIAPGYAAYAEKLSSKADSILASLDQEAFNAGLKALRRRAVELPSKAVTEPIDLLVFAKDG